VEVIAFPTRIPMRLQQGQATTVQHLWGGAVMVADGSLQVWAGGRLITPQDVSFLAEVAVQVIRTKTKAVPAAMVVDLFTLCVMEILVALAQWFLMVITVRILKVAPHLTLTLVVMRQAVVAQVEQ
jgi:hypothetical protein